MCAPHPRARRCRRDGRTALSDPPLPESARLLRARSSYDAGDFNELTVLLRWRGTIMCAARAHARSVAAERGVAGWTLHLAPQRAALRPHSTPTLAIWRGGGAVLWGPRPDRESVRVREAAQLAVESESAHCQRSSASAPRGRGRQSRHAMRRLRARGSGRSVEETGLLGDIPPPRAPRLAVPCRRPKQRHGE